MPGRRKEKKRQRQENDKGLFGESEQSEPRRITPVDIQQKEFRLAMRGYHERDVDQFLDELTEEVARLYAENKRLREELETGGSGGLATGSGVAEAEAALRRARDEAARIIADAESRARTISAAAPAPGASTGVPGVTGAALAGFLSREKSFLQNLAKMMQDHANAMKEDVRRVRETATGRAGGSAGAGSSSGRVAPAVASEPAEPGGEHELWRPPQQASGQSSGTPAPSAGEAREEPSHRLDQSRGDQPPYFMDEGIQGPDRGPQPGGAPIPGGGPADAGREEPHRTGSVIDLMDLEGPPREGEAETGAQAEAEAEAEAHRPEEQGSEGDAPSTPYDDEPTRGWTLGEGGADTHEVEDLPIRGDAGPAPRTRSGRWGPRAEEEDAGDDRSLKELFWGED